MFERLMVDLIITEPLTLLLITVVLIHFYFLAKEDLEEIKDKKWKSSKQ